MRRWGKEKGNGKEPEGGERGGGTTSLAAFPNAEGEGLSRDSPTASLVVGSSLSSLSSHSPPPSPTRSSTFLSKHSVTPTLPPPNCQRIKTANFSSSMAFDMSQNYQFADGIPPFFIFFFFSSFLFLLPFFAFL